MAGNVGTSTTRVATTSSFVDRFGTHASKVMLGACILGLVAAFLPAVTVSILGISESVAVWRDWRGKLALLGYIGIAAMAVMMIRDQMLANRKRMLGCVITAGMVLVMALWLPLSIRSSDLGSAVSMGVGVYVNILAALVLAGGVAVEARRSKLF